MANFTVSSLSTWPNPDGSKVLRNLLLDGDATADHYSFEDGIKDYKTLHYAKSTAIDVSTGAVAGIPSSLTAGGGVTLLPITLQVTALKIIPEFYTHEQLDKVTASVFNKMGSNPENAFAPALLDVMNTDKPKELFYYNEIYIWQADTSTSVQTAGTVLNKVDGILAQLRTKGAGAFGNAAVDLTSLSDASIRDHVKILYNAAVKAKPAIAKTASILSVGPAQYQAIYAATFGLNGLQDRNTLNAGSAELVSSFKAPFAQNLTVQFEAGLDGKNNLILTTPKNIIIGYDDSTEDNQIDLWYNKVFHAWELDAYWKIGMIVADASNCFMTI